LKVSADIVLLGVPLIAALITALLPKRAGIIKQVIGIVVPAWCFRQIWVLKRAVLTRYFVVDNFNYFFGLALVAFVLVVGWYSLSFRKREELDDSFWPWLLATLSASLGVLFAKNLLLLLVMWGALGITLYKMVLISAPTSAESAKKTLVIVGGTDGLLLLGVVIISVLTASWDMPAKPLPLGNALAWLAFICLLLAAFAKAGAFPVHTWIPDVCRDAKAPVAALFPGALDKLIGIYFLVRIVKDIFAIGGQPNVLLMVIGAITIFGGVAMALLQHDLKRLLGYHAVSQVGYMVLGIGTGNPVGLAGGLFHMLNNAIYKSGLLMGAGAVERATGKTDLDELGGLAKNLPLTFAGMMVCALAISGVPPLNGFASKWMIYQSLIELTHSGMKSWFVFLAVAMFGSALTLASFIKVLHAVFLGKGAESLSDEIKQGEKIEKGSLMNMGITVGVTAIASIVFGVFAFALPLKYMIFPAIGKEAYPAGAWVPIAATGLLLLGLAIGLVIYLMSNFNLRTSKAFIGGEEETPDMRLSGTDFYNALRDYGLMRWLYKGAEKGLFDVYIVGRAVTGYFIRDLKLLHSGVLPSYLSWMLVGLVILLYVFVRW